MLRSELFEILVNRENSGVEFKRDDIRPEQLGKEIVALANLNGGHILLGVEDDGTISGIQRLELQEWVLNVFRDKVHPQILPFYEEVQVDDKRVAVISFSPGISKPYVLRNNGREEIYVRMGDRSELATREQQARLFALGGMLHTEVMRDYGYVDARGMGVRTKIIPLMRSQNGREPIFELTDDYLKTTLLRKV